MNESLTGLTMTVLMPLLIGAMLMIAPLTRRRILMFSVRVRPEWSGTEEANLIVRRYRIQVALLSAIAACLGYWGLLSRQAWAFVGGPLLLTAGAVVFFQLGRRATSPFADSEPPVRSASLAAEEAPAASTLHQVMPFLILTATALWLAMHWGDLPERFPMHWDMAGNPNGWSNRTTGGVYGPLVIGALVCLLMLATSLGLIHGSARLAGGKKTVRWQMLRMFRWMGYLMSVMFASIGLMPLYPHYIKPGQMAPLIIGATIAMIIPVIRASSDPDGSGAERTPDQAWKWGLFYYNPDDPALMVEKRMGIGYTLNFGNRLSWVLTAVVLAIPLVGMVLKS